ncbi:hypothetical protein F2Q68_00010766 [Brassica cretica]|nr:hypothetical protein F2Q68_00010766 [Brassica cretica]
MNLIVVVLLIISFAIAPAISTVPKECETDSTNSCIDKTKALTLKIIAIVAILVTSMIGTSFMHVLPDSFEMLSSPYLEDDPWHKFPFAGCVAMLFCLVTLAIDSIATSIYTRKDVCDGSEDTTSPLIIHIDHLQITTRETSSTCSKQLLRIGYRSQPSTKPLESEVLLVASDAGTSCVASGVASSQ